MTDSPNVREREALAAWTPLEPPAGFAGRVLAVRDAHRRMRWVAVAGAVTAVAAVVAIVWVPQPSKAPGITPIVALPAWAPAFHSSAGDDVDLEVTVGDSFTIHEPSKGTRVRFVPNGDKSLCGRPSIEVRGWAFRPAHLDSKVTLPETSSDTVFMPPGSWEYSVSCPIPEGPGVEKSVPVGTGHITVLQDDGRSSVPLMPHRVPQAIVIETPAAGAPWSKDKITAFGMMTLGWRLREDGHPAPASGDVRSGSMPCRNESMRCGFHVEWRGPSTHHVLTFDAPDGSVHYYVLRPPPI
jgi:hypothetical protein